MDPTDATQDPSLGEYLNKVKKNLQDRYVPYCMYMICAGVLLQWLQSTPLLENISHLIVDEIHERDINSDFLITIIKDILPLRPDLKVSSSL